MEGGRTLARAEIQLDHREGVKFPAWGGDLGAPEDAVIHLLEIWMNHWQLHVHFGLKSGSPDPSLQRKLADPARSDVIIGRQFSVVARCRHHGGAHSDGPEFSVELRVTQLRH